MVNIKILWAKFAADTLAEIYQYYKEVAGIDVAKKIKNEILISSKQLEKHPKSGQEEETLKKLGEGHRYLVSGNFKIIYKIIREGVLITDVFDSRQDPAKINDPGRAK